LKEGKRFVMMGPHLNEEIKMAKKLGVVNPDAAPVSVPPQAPPPIGQVASQEVNRPAESRPQGVVPPSETVVTVTPAGPPAPAFGVVSNVVSAAPPPPPAPKPIGVIEPEAGFPSNHAPVAPKIGVLGNQVVTPAAVAANVPETVSDAGKISIPNVVDPFEKKEQA
jgi:hypothetical protein